MKILRVTIQNDGDNIAIELDNDEIVWLDADQLIDLAEIANKMP